MTAPKNPDQVNSTQKAADYHLHRWGALITVDEKTGARTYGNTFCIRCGMAYTRHSKQGHCGEDQP